MRIQFYFLGSGHGSAEEKIRILIRPVFEMKKNIFTFSVGRHKFDLKNHDFTLELVDSGLYFVQDINNFIHPLVGSRSDEKVTDPDGQKIYGSNRIRILIKIKYT